MYKKQARNPCKKASNEDTDTEFLFVIVLCLVLKCNSNMSFIINPCFPNFNWHLKLLIMQKKSVSVPSFKAFFRDTGLVSYT